MEESKYDRLPHAGDFEKNKGTEALYLAPNPLPTGVVPFSGQRMHREINAVFLDFGPGGGGLEFAIRLSVGSVMNMVIFFLLLGLGLGVHAYIEYGSPFYEILVNLILPSYFIWGFLAFMILTAGIPLTKTILEVINEPPIRFNRQRREVAYVPKKGQPPLIVPWEEVIACVTVGSVVTEYAVMPSASLMIGLRDSSSGEVAWLTIPTGHLSLAVSEWEALRVYMEEGPEAVPVTLLTDEEFQEGTVAYFHMCREVYREMHAWPVYAFGFLTIQFCSGWTLPCRLAQWVSNQPKAAFPDSIVEWSKPIPAEQHAQPSPELLQQSAEVREAFSQGLSLLEFYNIKFSQDKASPDNELGQ